MAMNKALRGWLIAFAICVLVTIVVVKVAGDRHNACEGKPSACLNGM